MTFHVGQTNTVIIRRTVTFNARMRCHSARGAGGGAYDRDFHGNDMSAVQATDWYKTGFNDAKHGNPKWPPPAPAREEYLKGYAAAKSVVTQEHSDG